MALVKVNEISLAAAVESATLGVLPGSPTWFLLEPNTINSFGKTLTKTARNPISRLRQRRKGTTTDLDSGVEFEADMTGDHFIFFAEGFVFASFSSIVELQAGASFSSLAAALDPPPAGTDSGYTHSALSGAIPTRTLLYARGFSTPGNNGLAEVVAGSTTTATLVDKVLVNETPTQVSNARVSVAGYRTAAGDVDLTVGGGGVGSLASTLLDFTTLGLVVGQFIHIGGLTAATRYDSGRFGRARVTSIAANLLGLDKIDTDGATGLATEASNVNEVDLLFGRFLRNVDVLASNYLERSWTFELALPNLGGVGTDGYYYARGNFGDTMSVNLPGQEKATVTFGFVGTDTSDPTTSRASGAATPINPVQTTAYNTSTDIARLRIVQVDDTGLTTCFKSLTFTMANGVTAEKCLGSLGALGLNTSNFLVDIETQATFDSLEVIAAITANETVSMDWVLKNGDGAVAFDVPAMTLGGGDLELPEGESVLINLTGEAFAHPTLLTSVGLSLFPAYPQ